MKESEIPQSVCLKCTTVLQFDHELRLIELSTADYRALPMSTRSAVERVQRTARKIDRTGMNQT
jgi:hypothetical protein